MQTNLFLKKTSLKKLRNLAKGKIKASFSPPFNYRFYSICHLKLLFALAIATIAILVAPTKGFSQTSPNPIRTCAYNPDSGQPNPLGMRAFITAVEQDGDTTFRLEQFPTPVGGQQPGVTIASRRELTFYNLNLEQARQLLLQNPNYYLELLGYSTPESFAPVNTVLLCQTVGINTPQATPEPTSIPSIQPNNLPQAIPTPQPNLNSQSTPTPQVVPRATPSTSVASTISDLPDGNYRYWSRQPNRTTVTDQELLQGGGYLFIFRKIGTQIVGRLNRGDSANSMCIVGSVNGNTVAGFAYPSNAIVTYLGENFVQWESAPYLQIRWGQRRGRQSRYDSALLNLNGFSRINAGLQLPPARCP